MSTSFNDTTHIMVDIETLDTAHTAKILSIGAIAFNTHVPISGFNERFYMAVNPIAGGNLKRTESQSTSDWWQTQAAGVMAEAFGGLDSLESALAEFVRFCNSFRGDKLFWCKGVNFDFPILEHAINNSDSIGKPFIPWKYNQLMDCRTVFKLFPSIKGTPNPEAHNALSDATYQAIHLQAIMILKGGI